MNLKDMITGGVSQLVDSVSSGLDSLFTSDDERNQAKIIIQQEANKFKTALLAAQAAFDKEITERWKSDNEHGITRLVRPISYGFVLILFAILALLDGNAWGFSVNEKYIPVIELLLSIMTVAYFGSRGLEKIASTIKGK